MPTTLLLNTSNWDPVDAQSSLYRTLRYKFPLSVAIQEQEIAVVESMFYNSFFNITAAKGNNVIPMRFPVFTGANTYAMQTYTCTVRDGFYSIGQLYEYLQNFCIGAGLYLFDSINNVNIFFFVLGVNETAYASQLSLYYLPSASQAAALGWTIPAGSPLVLNSATGAGTQLVCPQVSISVALAPLLGFTTTGYYPPAPIVTTSSTWPSSPAASYLSPEAPQINPVEVVIIRCNLVNQGGIGYPVDSIAQVPLQAAIGAANSSIPSYPLFCDVVNAQYLQFDISFMDQDLNPLSFKDPSIALTLQLRDRAQKVKISQ